MLLRAKMLTLPIKSGNMAPKLLIKTEKSGNMALKMLMLHKSASLKNGVGNADFVKWCLK
jgi:hypothetical protein